MSSKKTPMTPAAAGRIQAHADRTNTNQGFKGRAQRAAVQGEPIRTVKSGGKAGSGKRK